MCSVDESRGSPEGDHLVVMERGDCNEQRDKMREDIFDDRYFGRLPVNEVLLDCTIFIHSPLFYLILG